MVERDFSEEDPLDRGIAGGSALHEYERRAKSRDDRLEAKFGRFSPFVKWLGGEPKHIAAWRKGADGEHKLAELLIARLGDRAVVLNDRSIPGSRANIDHIVIAPSGVWVIDAKNWSGEIRTRRVRSWGKGSVHLFVAGRDRQAVVESMQRQVDQVSNSIVSARVPVIGLSAS